MSIARDLDIILAHGPELSASGIDYYKFGLWAAGLPKTRILALDPALPREELVLRLRTFLRHGPKHRVLLAALDPQQRAQNIIRLLLDEIGINPEFLGVLDLQEALGYPDPKTCCLKAETLIRMAAIMLTRAEPIVTQELAVPSRVLVYGDSYAALKSAVDLADQEYAVLLAFPQATLHPLVPGVALTPAVGEELNQLLARAQAHPAIQLLPQTRILAVAGSAGNFQVRLKTPEEVVEEQVGAMIISPELELQPGEAVGAPVNHPRVLTQTRLEEILAAPAEAGDLLGPGDARLQVAFLGADSHPLALRRALETATKLLGRDHCQVLLFIRDAKVGAPGLEADLEEAASAGLIVVKLPKLPALSLEDDRPRLRFFDPIMHQEESLSCDLVVLSEVYAPGAANAGLRDVLNLWPSPPGFLQGDNVRNLPVSTNRRGIYVAGPARAAMELDQSLAEAEAAVSEVHQLLGRGKATAPKGRAVIDRGRCVLCLTCERLCPHGAVSWDNRAIINELACQGCGICASQCPNEAIQIRNFTDDQVVAAMENLDPRLTPKIITFLCQNSAWEAYLAAVKMHQAVLPLGFTPLRMPCAGKIDIDYLLKAFTYGAEAVLVLGCHPDNCRSQHGNIHALSRVERAQALLEEAGVDPRRLVFRTLAANAPQDFLAAVRHLADFLAGLKAA